jgi:hypothetical protein
MSDEIATLKRQVAALEKRMTEMERYHYFPVTPTDLKDSAGTTWTAASIGTGTYTFRPEDNANIWPARARAVVVAVSGVWSSASASSNLITSRASAGAAEMYVGALVANNGASVQGVQVVDTNGYFYAKVSGATTTGTVRIVGYIV